MSVGFTHFIALCIGATSLAIPVAGLAAGPDPANYPALSTQQMGHYETAGSGSSFGSFNPMARAAKGRQATTVDPRHTRPIIWYE